MASNSSRTISLYAKDLIDAQAGVLGIEWTNYGNQERIPETPAVVIEPARKTSELVNTSLQVQNSFELAVFVYHTGVDGNESIQEAADLLTEELEALLNEDAVSAASGGTQFGGHLIHGHVTSIDYGFIRLEDGLMRANRIIFSGISRTDLIDG